VAARYKDKGSISIEETTRSFDFFIHMASIETKREAIIKGQNNNAIKTSIFT
jgi:hypothetical protein